MAVEQAAAPGELDESLPAGSDFQDEGDNHIRLIKAVLKTTFGQITGVATQAEAESQTSLSPSKVLTVERGYQQTTARLVSQSVVEQGADNSKLVTPLRMAQYLNYRKASETVQGTIELATNAETLAGTDASRGITPKTLFTAVGNMVGQTADSMIPPGIICMWSGSAASIPEGWALCNGSNGTPNLQDQFIVGAGNSYSPGNTGGANSVALTIAQLPSHNHSASTGAAGNHTHTYSTHYTAESSPNTSRFSPYRTNGTHYANRSGSINAAGNHTHPVSVGATGSGHSHENRPPYYALCFIMRLAWD